MKIGLLIIATNKYTQFLQSLISSADEYFLNNKDVMYFIFSNKEILLETKRNYKIIEIQHKEWPWITLERYKTFSNNSEELSKMDYLYYCDVDMLFVDYINDEIIDERVGTIHPGFYMDVKLSNVALEKRLESLAYIEPNKLKRYYAGGFNGGNSLEFLKMSKIISDNIDIDYLKYNIIAEWHDESHMNKYFLENPPTKELDPSYCYPESWSLPYKKKLVALDKNHSEIRTL